MFRLTKYQTALISLPVVAVSCADSSENLAGEKPNILIVVADDQSFPHAGAYGCNWVSTPAFDRVAGNGILFNNCYTPNAKSAPSRACLLTGRYSWQLEEAGNHIGFWPENKYQTFMEALAENGYSAGFTGKGWAPGKPGKLNGEPRRLTGTPYQKLKAEPPTSRIGKTDYSGNFKEFMAQKDSDNPWVFWFGSTEPHREYEYGSGAAKGGMNTAEISKVPSYWPDNETVRNDMLDYSYEISYFDSHLMRILDFLDETGELDNTVVIVTADNGMPFPHCKGMQYETSVHLPLAIMWPEGIKNPGRSSDELISFVDFAPTILKLAGLSEQDTKMEETSGTEFTDILTDKVRHEREYLVLGQERHDYGRPANQGYPIRTLLKDGYLYIHNLKPWLWPAGDPVTGYLNTDGSPTKTEILNLRREHIDTLLWNKSFGRRPQEELYNLNEDSECMNNLAGDKKYISVKKEMKKILFEELKKQNDPRLSSNPDIFDSYPFYSEECTYYYERYVSGEISKYQTDWVNASDYEKEDIGYVLKEMKTPLTGTWGDQADGSYRNPILNSNYPDCDVEKFGDKWYMISSKGKYMKGMTILESEDLVNWSIIGGIVDSLSWKTSTGVWAGDLAWHEGKWYCYFIDFETGLFLCTADDIKGPWSAPVLMLEKKGMTDPSVFWDYDRKEAYLICNYQIDREKPKDAGIYHQRLFRLSWDGINLSDEGKEVYVETGAEAAKIYKINGIYYIFISEWTTDSSGAKMDRRQIVLRSEKIYGPYEKKVLLEKDSVTGRSCCQGSLIQAPDSSWWYIHQMVQAENTFEGRPLCLIPAFWSEGWPLLGIDSDGNGIGNTVWSYRKPVQGKEIRTAQTDDDFNNASLSAHWLWSGNPVPGKHSLSANPGFLRLYSTTPANMKRKYHSLPNKLVQRKMGRLRDTVTVKLSLSGMVDGQSAGLMCIGYNYEAVGAEQKDGILQLYCENDRTKAYSEPIGQDEVLLRICLDGRVCSTYYSLNQKDYHKIGSEFELKTRGFDGLFIGLFSMHEDGQGYADYDWIKYEYDGPKHISLVSLDS